jgi:hypothetical protein
MAAFIKEQEAIAELDQLEKLFTSQEIPGKAFQGLYKYYLYTSFYFFLSEGFFEGVLKKLAYSVDAIRFSSLDPLPTYHYENFDGYSIIKLDRFDDFESLISLLDKIPKGGNIADALLNHSTSVCFYPANEDTFAIYAHRDHDIAIVAFNDFKVKEEFKSFIESRFMFDRTGALEVMSLGFENRVLPPGFKESFEMNYPLL